MKINNKKFISLFFIIFIFLFLILSIVIKDKKVNYIENKILQQKPKISFSNIKSGTFMKEFDDYVSDQFPFRSEFIYLKNNINYILGQREFRGIYYTKNNRLLEKFTFNKSVIDENILELNNLSEKLGLETTLMAIPNSIAIYGDEIPKFGITDNQEDTLEYIKDTFKKEYYSPYKILKSNKDKYIYFNTDHHWTQLGAKLMYEDYFKKNINSNYSLIDDNFYGSYYSKAMLNQVKSDKIFAYDEYKNFSIEYDYTEKSDTLYDSSKLKTKNKYQYFLNGDPGIALITGKGEGEILILKDSFAHNFIPLLANDYSKIHIIDPRYFNESIEVYIKNNPNISKLYYIFSVSSLNASKIINIH